jgi:FkbM family methyltransferase
MTRSRQSRVLNALVEPALIGVAVCVATFILTQQHYRQRLLQADAYTQEPKAELAALARQYGPHHNSRNAEEWIIRDYFKDRRDGVFLDVGANHYQRESNTYFLEQSLGWSGIAIDALEEFAADYRTYRPRTRFVALFASDVPDTSVTFFVPAENKLVASASREFTVQEGAPGSARQVPTTTLNVVLDQAHIRKLDLLSMDIELSEPKALAGFDIDRFKPSLVCIEGHAEVRQPILNYFMRHGYVLVSEYLRADPVNLYFAPFGG